MVHFLFSLQVRFEHCSRSQRVCRTNQYNAHFPEPHMWAAEPWRIPLTWRCCPNPERISPTKEDTNKNIHFIIQKLNIWLQNNAFTSSKNFSSPPLLQIQHSCNFSSTFKKNEHDSCLRETMSYWFSRKRFELSIRSGHPGILQFTSQGLDSCERRVDFHGATSFMSLTSKSPLSVIFIFTFGNIYALVISCKSLREISFICQGNIVDGGGLTCLFV